MATGRWNVYWNEYSHDTYLYGSELEYIAKDNVVFKNDMMAPGTVIKKWKSKTNFQIDKTEPSLPMIDGESAYHISVDIDVPNGEEYLIQLVFYDRFENEAGSVFIRDREADFKCPLKTYSYAIHLVNAGLTCLTFHTIVIKELNEPKTSIKTTK